MLCSLYFREARFIRAGVNLVPSFGVIWISQLGAGMVRELNRVDE